MGPSGSGKAPWAHGALKEGLDLHSENCEGGLLVFEPLKGSSGIPLVQALFRDCSGPPVSGWVSCSAKKSFSR